MGQSVYTYVLDQHSASTAIYIFNQGKRLKPCGIDILTYGIIKFYISGAFGATEKVWGPN
jgi:hypothetical protein